MLAVTSKTSQPVIIQESRGKGILILSTVTELISSIALNGSTDNSIEKLMKILLCHLGMMCEDVPECPLTPAMLLVDQQVKAQLHFYISFSLIEISHASIFVSELVICK